MKNLIFLLFVILAFGKWTQDLKNQVSLGPTKAWIYFKDKNLPKNHFTFSSTLNLQTIQRRKMVNHPIVTEHDYPLTNEYIQDVLKITKSKDFLESLWLNAISLKITAEEMEKISKLDFVKSIDLVHAFKKEYPKNPSFDMLQNPNYIYGASQQQLTQMNIIKLHEQGYTGMNKTILIIDSGFRLKHNCFKKIKVLDSFDFINNVKDVDNQPNDHPEQYQHGTRTLSLLSCNLNGTFMGVAPDANFLLAKTEIIDKELPVEEDYFVRAVEWGEARGAQILSSSLGYDKWYTRQDMDGKTAVTSKILNYAIRKGITCVISAGNSGEEGITAPADSFYTIAVGAVNSNNAITPFSSRGPTSDGRIKPEVCALGESVLTADVFNNEAFTRISGTSFSAPIVAGIATLISSKNPKWTPYDIYQSFISTSSRSNNPDNVYGWGVVDALKAASSNITGFYGCSINCTSNGACYNNTCFCYKNFYGPSCEYEKTQCELMCKHGACNNENKCICNDGWMGRDCDVFSFIIFAATTTAVFVYLVLLLSICFCCCCCIGGSAFFSWRYFTEKKRRAAVSIEFNDKELHDSPLFEVGDANVNIKNEILDREFKGTFELDDEEEEKVE